ncbi:tubulin folding cofactor D C terminal-domain-containing protein [Alternaria rosae]|uniref:tubulin folding cofactor D C terminal-domain-containing protein n=1 Tax=Alternaria rosae TaxID=1187941 RepID=UPI001E8D12BB|nr:tubulin folding cofactor D C terminal-domain-containing protein [Alternaria rosae]KAH6882251.1 tubulin folding cofactor D C terminal-domain-containing protein [Alternaria rosae]
MMSAGEDDDLKLQRASTSLLSDFERLLPRLLRKRQHGSALGPVRQHVRTTDMYKACSLIEPFQEDPQILDTHLKTFIPPLVAAYLEAISASAREEPKPGFVTLAYAICSVLNTFCKVRGEKVVKGFFNNEPRYLEAILGELEAIVVVKSKNADALQQETARPWIQRYVLLLWLSQLLLAPFPLESMSGLQVSAETPVALGLKLPAELPGVTLRVLSLCMSGLRSPTKERSAAASLLVRTCVRPDMQKLGLLDAMVQWSLAFFTDISEEKTDIHQCLGVLSFLSGLLASATNEELGPFLAAIYLSCKKILDQESLTFVKSSAVARKLVVKSLRNVVLHCLQATSTLPGLDSTVVLEEVIEFLLEALADGDTPVRYGASKALSIITLKLDTEMASEVVEAILGSLTENIYWQGSKRNLNSVNPLRWHGLTLTLAQLLYRKAISTSHLADVLNALLLSLGFEQRSPTGGSIGTNVRDAACFGIWALSRRYPTADLLAVETATIRASEHLRSLHVPQVLAIELVVAACLDPAGNIRRGSSAALQELIGRHPNTIEEGIPLVQIVDFHAVGLRQRAMCDVAIKAGDLQSLYWEALFGGLLDWRGTGSLDSDSRLFAAEAIGSLSKARSPAVVQKMSGQVRDKLAALRPREVEERQGLVTALATLVDMTVALHLDQAPENPYASLMALWTLFSRELELEDKAFTSPALRPQFTASSVCTFIGAISRLTNGSLSKLWPPNLPVAQVCNLLDLCLARHEESVLDAIAAAIPAVVSLLPRLPGSDTFGVVMSWLLRLENEASYNGSRCSGHAIALGAAHGSLNSLASDTERDVLQRRIVKVLTFRCTSAVAIEARTVALRALRCLLGSKSPESTQLAADVEDQIASALHIAFNDYTITERGDVGSLVRLEALNTIRLAWANGILTEKRNEREYDIYADIVRLSLEKLDKMRMNAAQVLQLREAGAATADEVSSRTYFLNALMSLQTAKTLTIREAICVGFVSSAGMGSESVVQNSRAALLDFVDILQDEDTSDVAQFALIDFANCVVTLLKNNITNDRVLLPLLEVVAFLFDMQVMQRLQSTSFNFRLLLSYTQKAHFKSTHMQKLHLALDVYRGLGVIIVARADTLAKVMSMLLHPFPKVRITAAETLWFLAHLDGLKRHDWSLPSKSLKPAVDSIKVMLTATEI